MLQKGYVFKKCTYNYVDNKNINIISFQVMMNTERLLKHAVQEKLAITVCINKVHTYYTYLLEDNI